MSTPYTHSVAETKERSYLSNGGSNVCVSGRCICLDFLENVLNVWVCFLGIYINTG